MKDKDGKVVYEGGKESSRNTKSMTKTMKLSSIPAQRNKISDESQIIERNKSPLLADLTSEKKYKHGYRKYSTQTSKMLGSRSATNSKCVFPTRHERKHNLHYKDKKLNHIHSSIEEDYDKHRPSLRNNQIVNINLNSKFKMGTVEINNTQGSSANVSSKRYLENDYEDTS